MVSERMQRRIDRLLDQAEEAADRRDWAEVRALVDEVLGIDPENQDAAALLRGAERVEGGGTASNGPSERPDTSTAAPAPAHPESFVGGHTGEPVKEADDFYGTHVVLASRIASTAEGREILVSSLLRDLVAASEPVALKGLDGEHVTYQVGWV